MVASGALELDSKVLWKFFPHQGFCGTWRIFLRGVSGIQAADYKTQSPVRAAPARIKSQAERTLSLFFSFSEFHDISQKRLQNFFHSDLSTGLVTNLGRLAIFHHYKWTLVLKLTKPFQSKMHFQVFYNVTKFRPWFKDDDFLGQESSSWLDKTTEICASAGPSSTAAPGCHWPHHFSIFCARFPGFYLTELPGTLKKRTSPKSEKSGIF